MVKPFEPISPVSLVQQGLEVLDQGVMIFDRDLTLVAWNRKSLDMLNFPSALGAPGTPYRAFLEFAAQRGDLGPGDIAQLVEERLRQARSGTAQRAELRPGGGAAVDSTVQPLADGGLAVISSDIAQAPANQRSLRDVLRQQTKALRLSEERLSLIADEVPAGIAHVDQNMNFLYANKRFARAYRQEPAAIIGLNAQDLLHHNTMQESSRFFEQARRGAQVDFEMRVELPGQRFKDVRTLLRPEKPSSGDVIGFYLVSIDVTRRKSTMSALMRSQKMDALGRMASGISHDFNNLLTIILGNLVPLSEQLEDSDLVEEYLLPSISATRRGSSLVKRLVAVARREQFDPMPTNINNAIVETCKLLKASIPSTLAVELSLDEALPCAEVDRSELEMALLNLAINARDATEGFGRITIETSLFALPSEEAEVFRIPADDYIKIRFADDGCGMSPEQAERIFEPFFTSKLAVAGSGLGLSMVYGFVEQSNGGIWVDTAPGQGAAFNILLPSVGMQCDDPPLTPAPDEAEEPAAPEPALGDAASADLQIVLLVEDDADVRRTIRRKIADLGHPLVEAGHASEALNLLGQIRDIGMVVTDIDMPGHMNGIDLANLVRSKFPGVGVILMSGQPHIIARGSPLDGVPFLRKPFSAEDLAEALKPFAGPGRAPVQDDV